MRKFVVMGDGELRLGDVNMHRDLLAPEEQCVGGGSYDFDYVGGRLLLDGKSYDYGKPQWHKVDCLRVSERYRGLDICWEGEAVTQWIEVHYF